MVMGLGLTAGRPFISHCTISTSAGYTSKLHIQFQSFLSILMRAVKVHVHTMKVQLVVARADYLFEAYVTLALCLAVPLDLRRHHSLGWIQFWLVCKYTSLFLSYFCVG